MSYIVLRGHWFNIIVLNVHPPSEEKSDDLKDRFYKVWGQVFNHLPKYSMKILLGNFVAKVGGENIFKLKTGNDTLHQDSNNNGVTIVNLATSKSLLLRASCSHTNIHKFTCTFPDGKPCNHIVHIWVDRRWHLSIPDTRSFRGAECDTDKHLVVAEVRERLAVSKQ
jgi:hypothetical protein